MRVTLKCDLDSVILDLQPRWLNLYNYTYNDNLSVEDIKTWDIHQYTKSECGRRIYNLLDHPGLFLGCAPVEGAIAGLLKIMRHVEVLIVTSLPQSGAGNIESQKRRWIHGHFRGQFPMENVIFTSRKELVRGDFLLDDAIHFLQSELDFKQTRGIVRFDQPWNRTQSLTIHKNQKYLSMYSWNDNAVRNLLNYMLHPDERLTQVKE